MRRRKKQGLIKTMTAAAAIAAISSGAFTVYASEGYTHIQVGRGSNRIEINQLSLDQTYRQSVINAFKNKSEVFVRDNQGNWYEMSKNATIDCIIDDTKYSERDVLYNE